MASLIYLQDDQGHPDHFLCSAQNTFTFPKHAQRGRTRVCSPDHERHEHC